MGADVFLREDHGNAPLWHWHRCPPARRRARRDCGNSPTRRDKRTLAEVQMWPALPRRTGLSQARLHEALRSRWGTLNLPPKEGHAPALCLRTRDVSTVQVSKDVSGPATNV